MKRAAKTRRKTEAERAIASGEALRIYIQKRGKRSSPPEGVGTTSSEEESKGGEDDGNGENEKGLAADRNKKKQSVRPEVWIYPGRERIDVSGLYRLTMLSRFPPTIHVMQKTRSWPKTIPPYLDVADDSGHSPPFGMVGRTISYLVPLQRKTKTTCNYWAT